MTSYSIIILYFELNTWQVCKHALSPLISSPSWILQGMPIAAASSWRVAAFQIPGYLRFHDNCRSLVYSVLRIVHEDVVFWYAVVYSSFLPSSCFVSPFFVERSRVRLQVEWWGLLVLWLLSQSALQPLQVLSFRIVWARCSLRQRYRLIYQPKHHLPRGFCCPHGCSICLKGR